MSELVVVSKSLVRKRSRSILFNVGEGLSKFCQLLACLIAFPFVLILLLYLEGQTRSQLNELRNKLLQTKESTEMIKEKIAFHETTLREFSLSAFFKECLS